MDPPLHEIGYGAGRWDCGVRLDLGDGIAAHVKKAAPDALVSVLKFSGPREVDVRVYVARGQRGPFEARTADGSFLLYPECDYTIAVAGSDRLRIVRETSHVIRRPDRISPPSSGPR